MGTSERAANRVVGTGLSLALVASVLLWLLLASVAIAQDSDIDFLVEPAEGSQLAESGGYFLLEMEPGTQVVQTLALRNDSAQRLPLELQAVDASTGPYGGASYGLPGETPERVGTWIELDESSLTLPPGGSARVDFRVNVPADATSGQHLAGLAIWSPAAEEGGGEAVGEDEAGASIAVQTRRVIAVQVDVPGPARAELVVTGVEPAARPDGLYFEIGIANVGTALTQGTGEIEVPSQDIFEVFEIDTFVPGTEIAYPVQWALSVPEGEYDARVLIEYEGGEATWEGSVVVGEGVRGELAERGVDVPGSSIPLWVWAAAAAFILAVPTVFLLLRRRGGVMPSRRRTRAPSRAPAPVAKASPAAKPPAATKAPRRDPSMPPPPPPPPPARTDSPPA